MPNATNICLFDGFRAERIYELIYPAKDPWVTGLGYAVTRDVASFLRYELRDDAGNPNPVALSRETVGIRRAYGSGTSSTGMIPAAGRRRQVHRGSKGKRRVALALGPAQGGAASPPAVRVRHAGAPC
jgi:hypothetical protein